jgi:hypothetical protein
MNKGAKLTWTLYLLVSLGLLFRKLQPGHFKAITILQLHGTPVGRRGVETMFVFHTLCHIFCVYAESVLSFQE